MRPIALDDLDKNSDMALTFKGARFGSSVSFFLVDAKPGDGPPLHKHPYDETFVVQEGTATFVVGDDELEVAAEQLLVVPKETPHTFRNGGTSALRLISISPRETMVTDWLA